MDWKSEIAGATVRMDVLERAGASCNARIEEVSGTRVCVTATGLSLEIGDPVRLETEKLLLLGEVIGVERGPEDRVYLDVRHSLDKDEAQQLRSALNPEARSASAAKG
jgi:hypothetical protein